MTSVKGASYNGNLLLERLNTREQLERSEKLQAENESLNEKNKSLEHELIQLVEGRIPGLLPLEFDVTIPIKQDYFRNISFIMTGTNQDRYYEYHVVMHNEGTRSIKPNVILSLFDGLGIQVGKTHLSNEYAASETESRELTPGETRSYSNQIKLDHESSPKYFLIDIK